ncbi:MAG: hypothetical protein HOG95_06615 [Rhodospirillaceae bacterium]|jgi:hypothetical protein|nr:hypothetical protein [Rhodospirillaceae bacterium]MBT5939585.1 hypothetical protein [Rhodospirillaceae bacterium]MBT7268793.1 hypothetical protein [Rhodospirillaceae bacterium]
MFDFTGDYETTVNWVFLAVTAVIAYKGITTKNEDGKSDFVHLLFGCIAAVFFMLVLFQDVLGVVKF